MELKDYDLTPQQQVLISLYMKTMNKSQSSQDAGYTSAAIFNNPSVKAAINEQLTIRASRLRVGADWVLKESVKVYDRCMQIEKVIDRNGEYTGEHKFDATNALKALTLIGKHVDVKAFDEPNVPLDINKELMARLKRGRERMKPAQEDDEISFLEPLEKVSFLEPEPELLEDDEPFMLDHHYHSDYVTTDIDIKTSDQKLQERLIHISKNNRERSE